MKQIDLREQAERLDPIIEQARRLLGGPDATLYLYDPDAGALELVTGTDRHARERIGTRLALGEGIAGKAARAGEPLLVSDYARWAGRSPQYDGIPWNQVMAAPLVHDGELFGVLDISDTDAPRRFTEDDLRLLSVFAELAALTLANLLLRDRAQRSEARYRALVEHALVGVYVIQDERIVYANPPLAELLGYAPEALVGLPMREVIAPEDRTLAHEKIVERLQRGVRADRYTLHLHHRDGHRVPVEVYASLVEYNGAPASQGQVLDMSERLASQRLLNRLLAIGADILKQSDVHAILQTVCDTVTAHSPFRAASVIVFEQPVAPEAEAFEVSDVYITGVSEDARRTLLESKARHDVIGNADILEKGQRIGQGYYLTAEAFPAIRDKGVPLQLESKAQKGDWNPFDNLYLFLRQEDKLIGRISLAQPRDGRVPTPERLQPLEALANLAALALIHARQQGALSQHQERLRGLYRLGQELADLNEEAALLDYVIRRLRHDFAFDFSAIWVREGEELVLRGKDSRVSDADAGPPLGARLPLGQGITGWVARQREPLLVNDVSQDPRYLVAHGDTRSEVCVPVLVEDALFGVLNIESLRRNAFERTDLELLASVAAQLGLALTNLRRLAAFKDQAIRDALTGLYNRHHFNETLAREGARAQRHGRPLAILFVDVDNLREINNRHGHLGGDRVLQGVAQLLRDTVRASDLIFRYGGDEFVVLLPETNGEAAAVVERLQRAQDDWNACEDAPPLSLSVGMSSWNPDSGQPLEALIQEADLRMYDQKRGG